MDESISSKPMIAFGPVPSRRLGRSLGINNIPPKVCSYACVYCQLGPTIKMRQERQTFYEPRTVANDVKRKVDEAREAGEGIDYLTFVPDGEPTLDSNLGREIDLLKSLEISIAVISNGSLIWREDVREDLKKADWVSLKLDAIGKDIWHQVNRPHGGLELESILQGMLDFAETYGGELATETMLVQGVNDQEEQLHGVAEFLERLRPDFAYLSIPTRPPACEWARAPEEEVINRAYQILRGRLEQVEYLIGYEGNAFASTGNAQEDLLSITAVHPMREEAVQEFLKRTGTEWTVVHELVERDQLVETEHEGAKFYMRKLR